LPSFHHFFNQTNNSLLFYIQNMLLYGMGGNVLTILPNVKPNKKIAFLVDFVYF